MVRVFANDPEERGLIPAQVIPKTQKMVLDVFLLNTYHNKVRIKSNWSNLGKGAATDSTLQLVGWLGFMAHQPL